MRWQAGEVCPGMPWKKIALALIVAVLVGSGAFVATLMGSGIDPAKYPATPHWAPAGDPGRFPEVTLSFLKTGQMTSQEAFAVRGGRILGDYTLGMGAALVRHPKGTLLFDAGLGTHAPQHLLTMAYAMRALSRFIPEKTAAEQLRPLVPDRIVLSHAHWDHVSGAEDFPTTPVWMPKAEADFIQTEAMGALAKQLLDPKRIHTFTFAPRPYENFESSLDLFDDGSVVLVPLPGHTWGSTGMFVNLRSGKRFFFIGDLTWTLRGVTAPAERPWLTRHFVDDNAEAVRRSVMKAHELSVRYPAMVIVPAHDRAVHERIAAWPASER